DDIAALPGPPAIAIDVDWATRKRNPAPVNRIFVVCPKRKEKSSLLLDLYVRKGAQRWYDASRLARAAKQGAGTAEEERLAAGASVVDLTWTPLGAQTAG